jgi:hypothetical protein
MFNQSTRRLVLSALPVILGVTSLAPASTTAAAAGPDGAAQLTLHLAGGDQNMFNVASAKVTGNQVTVTLADSRSSFDLANVGALGEAIPSMVLESQGCQQHFNDARVDSITFPGGATPSTSVAITATAQAPAKCQNAAASSAWNQVTNQPSSPPASGINVDVTAPTTTTGGPTSTAPVPPANVGSASAGAGAGKASGINVDVTAPTTTTGGQTNTAPATNSSQWDQPTTQAPTP